MSSNPKTEALKQSGMLRRRLAEAVKGRDRKTGSVRNRRRRGGSATALGLRVVAWKEPWAPVVAKCELAIMFFVTDAFRWLVWSFRWFFDA